MIKVFIADDHPIFRQGLKAILDTTMDIKVVGEAADGQEAIDKLSVADFDVMILDIAMARMGGLEALGKIKEIKPSLPVLIVSMYEEAQYAIRAIRMGASGYVKKSSATEELVKAIYWIHQGHKYITPSLAESLANIVSKDESKPLHFLLTDREFRVMGLIAKGRKSQEIAKELNLSTSTIGTYRDRILKKMGMKSNAELIHYAIDNRLIE